MTNPTPIQLLFLALLGGVIVALLWVVGLGPARRVASLQRILVLEDGHSVPPLDLYAQLEWLVQHRLRVLQQLSGFVGLALAIGVSQGLVHRAHDQWKGVRMRLWTLGRLGAVLSVALGLGALVAPWPLPLLPLAWSAAGLVGLVGYALAAGYPSIA